MGLFVLFFFLEEKQTEVVFVNLWRQGRGSALIVQWLFCLACTIYYGSLMNYTWQISLKILFKHETALARLWALGAFSVYFTVELGCIIKTIDAHDSHFVRNYCK